MKPLPHQAAARRRPAWQSAGRTFYVSDRASSDDRNDGLAPSRAWRTIERVNAADLRPGDTVLFRGSGEFRGNLRIVRRAEEPPARPIIFASTGKLPATILAGAGSGLLVRNAGGVHVRDLVFRGDGTDRSRASGIVFDNNLPGDIKLPDVRIERVEITGFGNFGITLGGRRGKSGYRNVRISHVHVHHNRVGGIETHGRFSRKATGYANEDVHVDHCDVHDHAGYCGSRRHVGNGIVVSDVDRATIEHCRAWNNGSRCTWRQGPVGIWAWDANAVTIQFCESHHNRTTGKADGGGFDLDGGVTNSIVQYNYSHDNDGAGFGVYQFRVARPLHGNIIRHNLSVNDGRRNGYAAFDLKNSGDGIRDVHVIENIVVLGPVEGEPLPAALQLKSPTADVQFLRNLVIVSGRVPFIRVRGPQAGLIVRDNLCIGPRGRNHPHLNGTNLIEAASSTAGRAFWRWASDAFRNAFPRRSTESRRPRLAAGP